MYLVVDEECHLSEALHEPDDRVLDPGDSWPDDDHGNPAN